jgi:hypothetical protein
MMAAAEGPRMPISQLIYFSRNCGPPPIKEELHRILDASRHNNQRNAITGYLIADGTWFIQILEGDHTAVQATFERIRLDPRHEDVTVINLREIRTRGFPQWSMGASIRTPAHDAIMARHGISTLDPPKLLAPVVVALAMDLQDFERAHSADLAGSK